MRKVMMVLMALVMVASLAHGATTTTSSPLTSYAKTVVTQKDTVMRTVTTDTLTGAPWTPTLGSGINCTNWRKGVVYVSVVGTSAGAVITPAYGFYTGDSVATGRYFYGTDRTVSSDSVFVVDLYGCQDFNVKVGEITGSAGTKVSVFIEPCTD